MLKYSIEFAHIYLNQNIGQEHKRSLAVFKSLVDNLKKDDDISYQSVVLVDDYNATERVLEVESLPSIFEAEGVRPDLIASEASLEEQGHLLLKKSKGYEAKSSKGFYQVNGKLPCSLLVATWYLIRLGRLEQPSNLLIHKESKKLEIADKLINILPDYYEKIEKRAADLIKESEYSDAVSLINNNYFPS